MASNLKKLRVSLVTVTGPSNWPSLSVVSPELVKSLRSLLPSAKTFDIFGSTFNKLPVTDDLWIFPVGLVQADTLKWLRESFKSPYKRPRILFFLGGEGSKLGYNLTFFKDVFRIDDEWIVSSEVELQLVNHLFPNNNRTSVLHYPVASKFRPLKSIADKKELRKKLHLPIGKSLILYAGRISEQKNVTHLLDLLEQFPKLHLIICGDVDSLGVPHFDNVPKKHLPTILIHEIAKRKLSERIEFRGFLSQDDLVKMMKACDYQISLSAHYGEDFGYSIAQGLACGLKTILSHWGGHLNWKKFFTGEELSYVDLNWDGNSFSGEPIQLKKLQLPKKSHIDFQKVYRKTFDHNFKKIIYEPDYANRSAKIEVLTVLSDYWKNIIEHPRPSMFLSKEDLCFKIVKEFYAGRF